MKLNDVLINSDNLGKIVLHPQFMSIESKNDEFGKLFLFRLKFRCKSVTAYYSIHNSDVNPDTPHSGNFKSVWLSPIKTNDNKDIISDGEFITIDVLAYREPEVVKI